MKLSRAASSILLAASLAAEQLPAHRSKQPAPVNWQAPPDAAAQQPKPQAQKKKSGRKKWIIIAAVAGAAVVGLVLINKRLSNEGAGIF